MNYSQCLRLQVVDVERLRPLKKTEKRIFYTISLFKNGISLSKLSTIASDLNMEEISKILLKLHSENYIYLIKKGAKGEIVIISKKIN